MNGWTLAAAYWWLIFPIMGFTMGGFRMWMNYKRHQDTMELMKTYAAQGKDPQELAKILSATNTAEYGGWGGWGGGWSGRGGFNYYGPLREWRRTVVFTALAAGFGIAAYYDVLPGTEEPFYFVAIIMGVMAASSLIFALLATSLANKQKNDK